MNVLSPESLTLLTGTLEALAPLDLALSIEISRQAGTRAAAASGAVLETPDAGATYLATIVSVARSEGVLDDAGHAMWMLKANTGELLRDPRVQAFSAAWIQGRAILGDREYVSRSNAIAQTLGVSQQDVEFASLGPDGMIVFGIGPERFLVLEYEEHQALKSTQPHFFQDFDIATYLTNSYVIVRFLS